MEKGITKISVAGFKSIANETTLDIKPLTLLAGANSSGKSSFMQPLLLMKQTLETSFEPAAPLLINGKNARFTFFDQLFSGDGKKREQEFTVGLYESNSFIRTTFKNDKSNRSLLIDNTSFCHSPELPAFSLRESMPREQLLDFFQSDVLPVEYYRPAEPIELNLLKAQTYRERFFITVDFVYGEDKGWVLRISSKNNQTVLNILRVIHVPGLRGNPERSYRAAQMTDTEPMSSFFPETFEGYPASVIAKWEEEKSDKLHRLCDNLSQLGLTSKISAKRLSDVEIEVMVARLPKNGRSKSDMVSIADVGFGVSQTLPVLVALLVAEPGQLVYLEQPEIHLHPRAQRALAEILVEAANRGVKVVAETHSSMLLLAVQTLVAKKKIDSKNVALHWFQRDKAGMTDVSTAVLTEQGTFGEWPVDFDDVELEAESDYLKAVTMARRGRK